MWNMFFFYSETTSSVKVVVTENIQTTFPDKEIIGQDNINILLLLLGRIQRT